jgi:hypothetical protein
LLFWTALGGSAEEDHRRFPLLAEREESPEISVGGYDNAPLLFGAIEDRHVALRLEAVVTYMSAP